MDITFYTTDVFTETRFNGAQIAVIANAKGLNQLQMQKIAREFNLSESVFIIPRDAHRYRLHIFTPYQEMDFGSHTIMAAAHVLASIGTITLSAQHTPVTFELNTGDIEVNITADNERPVLAQFTLETQPIVDNYVPRTQELASILGLEPDDLQGKPYRPLLVSNQGLYLVVPVANFDCVRRAIFSLKDWNQSLAPSTLAQNILLFATQTESSQANFHLRLLGPQLSASDDPPVGSAIPAFSAYLCAHEHIKTGTYSFVAERGLKETRQSLLHVEMDHKNSDHLKLRVGGSAVMVSEGRMHLPD